MPAASASHPPRATRTPLARHLRRAVGRDGCPLCRPVDRARSRLLLSALLALLLVVALAVVVALASLATLRTEAREAAQHRHRVTATATSTAAEDPGPASLAAHAQAVWTDPQGVTRSGSIEAPAGTAVGEQVPLWIDDQGAPAESPRSTAETALFATGYGLGTLVLGSAAIASGCAVRRRILDRRAERAWEPDWELVEPLWSGRGRRGRPEAGER
ncbi:hypothetical protein [Kitasatospora camelliae]|uniref:Integral membrane protein n=1 Tax=Kitasatospora camelliae TaxID=3156397 RepID=A0AAU8K4B9_9ACTN